jgi:hypothetical protein
MIHRLVLPDAKQINHINGNGLDNRRENLRSVTSAENHRNSRKRTRATSQFKGVHWLVQGKKWRAMIYVNGKQRHLGCFARETDAALAYDVAARKHFGEFARPNLTNR